MELEFVLELNIFREFELPHQVSPCSANNLLDNAERRPS
jgi:hypothetical protein